MENAETLSYFLPISNSAICTALVAAPLRGNPKSNGLNHEIRYISLALYIVKRFEIRFYLIKLAAGVYLFLLLYSSGRDIFAMNPLEIQIVREISTMPYDCSARASARVILFTAFGEPLILEFDGNENRSASASNISDSISTSHLSDPFPNPAADIIYIPYTLKDSVTSKLLVYDVNGRLVYNEQLIHGNYIFTLDVSDWANGIYMAVFSNEQGVISRKKLVVNNFSQQ